MEYQFSIRKLVFENDALIAFIDLLGTRKSYANGTTEQQAKSTLYRLLTSFNTRFSKYFRDHGIRQNFDVSIFADSIVVSPRNSTPNIVQRLVDFSLCYQAHVLFSQAIIIKDAFSPFKVATDPSTRSILGSPYTSISLCGGRGIIIADDSLKGLPIGVYVAEKIKNDLNVEQKERAIPVRNDKNLLFIKQKHDIRNFLPDEAGHFLAKNPNAGIKAIRHSLKASYSDEDALEKLLPWVLVHLGRENEIIKSNKPLKRDTAERRAP